MAGEDGSEFLGSSAEGPIESPYFYLQTTAKLHLEEVF